MVVGRYQLISHGTYKENIFSPTSSYLKGELIYSSDGFLSVLIFFRESVTSEKDFLAYTGTFEHKSEYEILHHISLCSQSKRNGTIESRTFKSSGNRIYLGINMGAERFEAVWAKVTAAGGSES